MYRNLICLISILLVLNIGCQSDICYYQKVINKNIIDIDSVKAVVVIPGIGCMGCISGVEHYLKLHFKKLSNIKFVLTNVQSMKTLRLKIGDAIHSPNIYLDKDNLWYDSDNENSIYPIIIHVKNKKILEMKYISPASPQSIQTILKDWGIFLPS